MQIKSPNNLYIHFLNLANVMSSTRESLSRWNQLGVVTSSSQKSRD